jgi:hypothetical protein
MVSFFYFQAKAMTNPLIPAIHGNVCQKNKKQKIKIKAKNKNLK